MMSNEQIENVLAQVRPYLQADGGDIELVEVQGQSASVRLKGTCVGCPSAPMTLQFGVEAALREAIPGFGTLSVL